MAEQITFSRSLYLPAAVEAAAAAYAEYAHIEVTPAADDVVAVISAVVGYDLQTVANAFCNYALQETIAQRRQVSLQEVA